MDYSREIPIKVAARLIYHLGEQLISDELVALLELIKNSYDADATTCEVIVDSEAETPYGKGKIVIKDNGNGMLPRTITKDFLRLATNYKRVNKVSPFYKRRALGEKGLGRLSFQRLGRYIVIETSPRCERFNIIDEEDIRIIQKEKLNCFVVELDWDGFSDDTDIGEVMATINYKNKEKLFLGTTITILGIRNDNFWKLTVGKRARLRDEILSIINPFVDQQGNGKFLLKVDVNGEEFYIDSIEEEVIQKLSDVNVKFAMSKGMLTVSASISEKYFNRQKAEYLKRMEESHFLLQNDNSIYENYMNKALVIDFNNKSDVKVKFPWIEEGLFNLIDDNIACNFEFKGQLYAVDKAAANRTDIAEDILKQSIFVQKNFTRIGQLWDRISGIFLYRDQFRILPYGKKDWLDFTRLSQKGKATLYKEGNVSGYIKVDGAKSETLKEQTNRQGILEDEYGYNFMLILRRAIAELVFNWDVSFRANFSAPKLDKENGVFYNLDNSIVFIQKPDPSKVYEKQSKEVAVFLATNDELDNQVSLFKSSDTHEMKKTVAEFKKASDDLTQKLNQDMYIAKSKLDEYKEIIPLLGQTIIMETVTHEISRIYSKMAKSVFEMDELVMDIGELDNELQKKLNAIKMSIKREINDLNRQLNYVAPTHRNRLKDEAIISIKEFIINNYVQSGVVASRLQEENIRCEVRGNDFNVRTSIGNAIVILDNIVINSEYWITKFEVVDKCIFFDLKENGTIDIWDSGRGIDKEIENRVFEPFHSLKDKGRGLGLYIVRELLNLMGAEISLLQERNIYGNRYKFSIRFRGVN
jgi:signal transduction histidine kinase